MSFKTISTNRCLALWAHVGRGMHRGGQVGRGEGGRNIVQIYTTTNRVIRRLGARGGERLGAIGC